MIARELRLCLIGFAPDAFERFGQSTQRQGIARLQVDTFEDALSALQAASERAYDAMLWFGSGAPIEVLQRAAVAQLAVPLGVVLDSKDADHAFSCVAWGATEILAPEDLFEVESFERFLLRTLARNATGVAASRDHLTGLDLEEGFRRRLRKLLRRARQVGQEIAMVALDIDRFRELNDAHGPDVGDEILAEIGLRISSVLEEGEVGCRARSDLFFAALAGTDRELRGRVAALHARCLEPLPMDVDVSLQVSVGVARAPEDGRFVEELAEVAERLMNQAKAGEEKVVYPALQGPEERARRQLVLDHISGAIQSGQLTLRYQPQVLGSGRVLRSFEALVRWEHPELGTIPPSEFIPVLEEAGRCFELDRWVIREAIGQRSRWVDAGLKPPPIAVNVSAQSFRRPSLVKEIMTALELSGQTADALEVEITETSVLDPRCESVLHRLAAFGVCIAIDDFGVGYAALGCLARTEAGLVKIDRSLIDHVDGRTRDGLLVTGLVRLAHELGLEVLAEGVERPEQHAFLVGVGVDAFQGFCFDRPLDARNATARLAHERREAQRHETDTLDLDSAPCVEDAAPARRD